MRRIRNTGNFLCSLCINLLLNLEGTIPAWLLLGAHFWFDISLLWFWGALALWGLSVLFRMIFWRWISRTSNEPKAERRNRNPYSVGQSESESEGDKTRS